MAGDGSLIADDDKYLEAQARDGEYIFDENQRVDMGLGITFEVVFGDGPRQILLIGAKAIFVS